jgi:translation initiation factor IF-2
MLAPTISEEVVATVEVRQIFKISKVGTIAGCYVKEGSITRGSKVRLIRDGVVVFDGMLDALKRFKDDVREVAQGFECGISLQNFNDIKVSDIIEAYKMVETKRTLE